MLTTKQKPTLNGADIDLLKGYFATKKDLSDALEKQELKFERKIEEVKNDFYTRIDPVLKEVLTAREDRTLTENRIEELESIHQTPPHALPL